MDIFANRRKWLAHWVETEFDGNKARAAAATGYSRAQISQFLSDTYQGGKSPQEKAARRIEERFGKPDRIMEQPAPTDEQTEFAKNTVRAFIPPESPWSRANISAEPPAYVRDATIALLTAYHAGAPRELFDSIRSILSLLVQSESATIKPSPTSDGQSDPRTGPNQDFAGLAEKESQATERHLKERAGGGIGSDRGKKRHSRSA
jgi:hypothetical protein